MSSSRPLSLVAFRIRRACFYCTTQHPPEAAWGSCFSGCESSPVPLADCLAAPPAGTASGVTDSRACSSASWLCSSAVWTWASSKDSGCTGPPDTTPPATDICRMAKGVTAALAASASVGLGAAAAMASASRSAAMKSMSAASVCDAAWRGDTMAAEAPALLAGLRLAGGAAPPGGSAVPRRCGPGLMTAAPRRAAAASDTADAEGAPPARRGGDTTPGVLARGVTGLPRGDAGPGDSGRGPLDWGALLGDSGRPASPPVRGVPTGRSPATVGRPPDAGGVAPGGWLRRAEGGDTAPAPPRGVRFAALIAGVGDAMPRGRTAPPAGLGPGDRGLVRGTAALTAAFWLPAPTPGRGAALACCPGDAGGACAGVK